jgi:PPK2 family polyphosphate:nucleotide phosphotransferase
MKDFEQSQSAESMKAFQAPTDGSFDIDRWSTRWEGPTSLRNLSEDELKSKAKKYLKANREHLKNAQELLWASNRRSVLIIFQAMDAAGKDSTIKHVMSGVNPQGVSVNSFKAPSPEELDHNFLWRYWNRMPERGKIGIFNRSYYEEVLIVKVHPEILENRPIPYGLRGDEFWNARYEDINAMERHLCRSGTVILKFFLHVSPEEQCRRFIKRLSKADKLWKFSESDVRERQHWDRYMGTFEDAIKATSTEWAPWYVIPADDKWKMRGIVSMIITAKIKSLDLKYPEVSDEKRDHYMDIKEKLVKGKL